MNDSSAAANPDGPKANILLVDDEEAVRSMLRRVLQKKFPHCRVEEACDGLEAGWKARGFLPDLMIVDLLLPSVDGFGVCQFIRAIPELKHVRILVMTGRGEENRERVMKLGADDFLTKPFDLKTLEQKIKALLRAT